MPEMLVRQFHHARHLVPSKTSPLPGGAKANANRRQRQRRRQQQLYTGTLFTLPLCTARVFYTTVVCIVRACSVRRTSSRQTCRAGFISFLRALRVPIQVCGLWFMATAHRRVLVYVPAVCIMHVLFLVQRTDSVAVVAGQLHAAV